MLRKNFHSSRLLSALLVSLATLFIWSARASADSRIVFYQSPWVHSSEPVIVEHYHYYHHSGAPPHAYSRHYWKDQQRLEREYWKDRRRLEREYWKDQQRLEREYWKR